MLTITLLLVLLIFGTLVFLPLFTGAALVVIDVLIAIGIITFLVKLFGKKKKES